MCVCVCVVCVCEIYAYHVWRDYLNCFVRNRHQTRHTAAILLLHTLRKYYHDKPTYPSPNYECGPPHLGRYSKWHSVSRNTAKRSTISLQELKRAGLR